eukprot:UN02099
MKNLILNNSNQSILQQNSNGLHRRNNSPIPADPTLISTTNTVQSSHHQPHNKREQSINKEEKKQDKFQSLPQTNYSLKDINNYTTKQQQQHQIIPQHSIPWIVGLLLMMNVLCFGIAMYNKDLGSSLHQNYVENVIDIGHNVNIAFRSLFSHYNTHNNNNSGNNHANINPTLNNNK